MFSWHLNNLSVSVLVSPHFELIFQMVSHQFLKYSQYSPPDCAGNGTPAVSWIMFAVRAASSGWPQVLL